MAKHSSDDDLKRYYSIGEVAEKLGVNASQLRFWEGEFKHIKASKNSRGERRFTKDNIRQLEYVAYLLKDRGFTIEGARKEVARQKRPAADRAEMISRMQEVRRRLRKLLERE